MALSVLPKRGGMENGEFCLMVFTKAKSCALTSKDHRPDQHRSSDNVLPQAFLLLSEEFGGRRSFDEHNHYLIRSRPSRPGRGKDEIRYRTVNGVGASQMT